ncbi:hypothetical protein [Natrarchaeobaculum aegyptiacum]|uniref:Uncharacterized protein n=1 Tax=Natrarchaeobaculum aegyptiacum TaxID=745377 RepID=A0A2Z2HNT1_9EURY|nr:hypothetical protein [Natrarchaeobaculum aegyptiacum]ARS88562.1 hypothetical protein B1756_01510 [Natrarchaeobaculum aegyptiacum]
MVLHFRKATSVYTKTLPFVALQFGIGVLFAVLGMVYLGLIALLAYRFIWGGGGLSLVIVALVMVAGLASFALIWYVINRYVLYMVKAGHIAVIAHIVEEDEVPDNQITYGIKQVGEVFVEASAFFVVSAVIDAVLKQFNRAVARVQNMIPIRLPANLRTIITILQKSITLAVRYLDNAIIAYMFVDRNGWASARDGVVLYAKTWKMVLGSTLMIVVGMYVLSFVLFTLAAPLAIALDFLPTSIELLSWLFVAGFVAVVHTGVVKPWVKTVVITTFLIEQRKHTPDSETVNRVAERSDRFEELMEKAENDEPIAEDPPESDAGSERPQETGGDPADD